MYKINQCLIPFKKLLFKYYLQFRTYRILQTVKRKQHELLLEQQNLSEIEVNDGMSDNFSISSIVFSKDRAIQLNAFLSSYIALVKNYGKMYILYKCSDQRHLKSYEDLKRIYSDKPFIFVKEEDFRIQLIDILQKDLAKSIILYVDDMIFIRSLDYSEIKSIDTTKYILSLTRGRDLTFSVVLNKPLLVPAFQKYSDNFEMFDWFEYNIFSDWEFPLGVSGYMFGRKEYLTMLENITFKAPNSLEASMQIFLPLVKSKKGICPSKVSAVCVHANLVQTECKNIVLDTYSIEELLEQWENSMQIEIGEFYNKEATFAERLKYNFIKRS